ncbi:hypothetical protein P152DRAFT_282958 [Eremomyces bilateralis CBS 781.70]|uniref:Uncharacterized protein n=1 Tax=Eremomyces bilateralis CBS 781.70 TaxID=1392243 RepID=A0A6G1G9K4_9PEZI|nr:uncharacterized protein P152DRAFT_282958 [Eremomyces bilateralis CBS 781.70]KAF1814672.1 hypothetical protein P152DRAFT_282958 [Eremomyces bilateralis CBS 781.70]
MLRRPVGVHIRIIAGACSNYLQYGLSAMALVNMGKCPSPPQPFHSQESASTAAAALVCHAESSASHLAGYSLGGGGGGGGGVANIVWQECITSSPCILGWQIICGRGGSGEHHRNITGYGSQVRTGTHSRFIILFKNARNPVSLTYSRPPVSLNCFPSPNSIPRTSPL